MPAQQPEYVDEAFQDLAQWFVSRPDAPTPGSDAIDPQRFDFTLKSLHAMDDYLELMRNRELEDADWDILVLRGGAYVGEVLRRHVQPRQWHWIDYEDAIHMDSALAGMPKVLGTAAILADDQGGFWFPLGKVCKYLENGSADSVAYFARMVLAESAAGR